MRYLRRWGRAIPAVVLVCAQLAAAETDDAAATVRCTEIAFSHSVERRDLEAFAGMLDEDARFLGAEILRGRDAVVAGWSAFFEGEYPRLTWRPRIVEALPGGELALSRGPYLYAARDEEGAVQESWGTYTSIWRRGDDGRWRVVFDAGHPGHGPLPEADASLLARSHEELLAACPDGGS